MFLCLCVCVAAADLTLSTAWQASTPPFAAQVSGGYRASISTPSHSVYSPLHCPISWLLSSLSWPAGRQVLQLPSFSPQLLRLQHCRGSDRDRAAGKAAVLDESSTVLAKPMLERLKSRLGEEYPF